jgi:uncharacterized protein YecA (UPF0149 family)
LGIFQVVQDWIDATDRMHEYMEAHSEGLVVTMDRGDASILARDCLSAHASIVRDLALSTGRNDPCFCGSGRKFKKCCARLIDVDT